MKLGVVRHITSAGSPKIFPSCRPPVRRITPDTVHAITGNKTKDSTGGDKNEISHQIRNRHLSLSCGFEEDECGWTD